MPHARPTPAIGPRCTELRVQDANVIWRIICRADADCIVIAAVFSKKTRATPTGIIETCKRRLRDYDRG